jgi:hypothetical protein
VSVDREPAAAPNRELTARVVVVLSTAHRLDVRVTDAEAAKVMKLLASFAKRG